MVKSGEVICSREELASACQGDLLSDRPRLICVPDDNLCGHVSWLNALFIPTFKALCPSFIHGMTTAELVARFQVSIDAGLRLPVSIDGSNHDGH
jgi:hypothetical protein